MVPVRIRAWGLALLTVCLWLASCGTAVRDAGLLSSPMEQVSPLATLTPEPTAAETVLPQPPASPNPEALPAATEAAGAAAAPLRLVVLHTNDNWGETEPCG